MDLEEFSMRIETSYKKGLINRKEFEESASILKAGYQESLNRFRDASGKESFGLLALDTVLWTSGSIIVKWGWKYIAKLGKAVTPVAILKQVEKAVGKLLEKSTEYTERQLEKWHILAGPGAEMATKEILKQQLPIHMRALMMKNRLLHNVYYAIKGTGTAANAAAHAEWPYILGMAGIQLTSETVTHVNEVWDPNPAVLSKNVLSNSEIMKNVQFMSRSAIMMTTATYGIQNRKVRMVACGFIALTHSLVANIWLKDDKDPTNLHRLSLDTGWEAIIGNSQVQFDTWIIQKYKNKAVTSKIPKLRFVGWVAMIAEQAVMFGVYSKLTQWLDPARPEYADELDDVQLIPVLLEE